LLVIGIFAFSMVSAAVDKGAGKMVLNGGKTGNVHFPHGVHQATLKDCNLCHQLFPRNQGIIDSLKNDGKLKKKQVMKQCQTCHRKMKKAGAKTGPTRCKACHSG
jgi:hypothetical protein